MPATEHETGRYRQRRRTRAAIVDAAMRLIAAGTMPSVSEIADAAEVSRRTVYLHFPTVEQLLLDATLGLLSQTAVDEAIDAVDIADDAGDAEARVEAMLDAIGRLSGETLPLGRALIKLTVDDPGATAPDAPHGAASVPKGGAGYPGAERARPEPRRGYRRIGWIEKAIEPLRDQLAPADFERLVSGLAMVIGWEALVVLHDLRGLGAEEQQGVCLWAARALIRASLADGV
jgi:AcrR family transcriptional regulator